MRLNLQKSALIGQKYCGRHVQNMDTPTKCASFRVSEKNQLEVEEAAWYVTLSECSQGFTAHFLPQPHTILLLQPTRGHETRTFTDYETEQECFEGIHWK